MRGENIGAQNGQGHFGRFSFRDTLEELERAVTWIEGYLGRKVDPTRIGRYRSSLKKATEQLESGELQAFLKKASEIEQRTVFEATLTSLYEVGEFVSIYNGLQALARSIETRKLRELISGPISYVDEGTGPASARNTAFELVLTARLAEVGLNPRLLPPADVTVKLQSTTFVFECKRPQSMGSLEDNLEAAFRQLRDRYRTARVPHLRGIAALDITKAANPDFYRYPAGSVRELDAMVGEALEKFARKRLPGWAKKAPHKTVGILLRLSLIGELQDVRLPAYVQQYLLVSLARPQSRDKLATDELYEVLLKQPTWKTSARG